MRITLTERFQAAVTERLRFLESSLVPVRAFFMDSENNEHFVFVDGSPEYPSPVDPQLLRIEHVYGDDLEARFLLEDENLDTFTLAGEALIPWFAECWRRAGGAGFRRAATIRLHDDSRIFDLIRGVWH